LIDTMRYVLRNVR